MDKGTRTVRIARKTLEAPDIVSFELVDPEEAPLPSFAAGAHVDVHAGPGIVRQYSLCNDPAESHRYVIAVLREARSRGGSSAMFALQEGDCLRISAPRNLFPLDEKASHSVLIAGGIGITPILSMAERLATLGASFELHFCTRSAVKTPFVGRILLARYRRNVLFHRDDEPRAQGLDLETVLARPAGGDAHLYVCGPSGFMQWVLDGARQAGWPDNRLHREFFAAAPAARDAASSAFDVVIASTGAVVHVEPGHTIAAALEAAGVEVPVACSQGVCGTCITRVLEGVPDHRDMFLTAEQQQKNDQFTPCCSRAKSARLVLDL